MIVAFITYSRHSRKQGKFNPHPVVYIGRVQMGPHRRVYLLDTKHGATKHGTKRNKATLFDDAVMPPRLIREDYDVTKLRKLGCKGLPELFTDMSGNIVDAKGKTIFEGPSSNLNLNQPENP